MAKYYLADTCYWLGLITPDDQHHDTSLTISQLIDEQQNMLLVPWPCLYETLATRLTNNRERLLHFESLINRKSQVQFIDDADYKIRAFEMVFEKAANEGFTTSLTDAVIIEILTSRDFKIDGLISYNHRDFESFCKGLDIEYIR